jgi:hypothetical protein
MGQNMASSFERGGNPGVENKETQPKKQVDPKALRQALGKAAVDGSQRKK